MQSLTTKLTLAFIVVCLAEAVLVALLVRQATQSAFDQFVREEAIEGFMADARMFYENHGTFHGFKGGRGRAPGMREGPESRGQERRRRANRPRPPRYGLADTTGAIIKAVDDYRVGDQLSVETLADGRPLLVDGRRVATVLPPTTSHALDRRERDYLERTDSVLLMATGGGVALALLLGVLIARGATKPIRRLTEASRAMAAGELKQQLPVTRKDELGELVKAFNRMSAELERANSLRRQMTADIAHELRTPLTVLLGYLEGMQNGSLKPEQKRLDAMYREAELMRLLIQDLRTLTLADAGELSLRIQPVDIAGLLEECAGAFAHEASARSLQLRVSSGTKGLPAVQADPDRIAQVINNLVSNALRYTPAGGSVDLEASLATNTLRICVRDSGRGIPPEALPHVFERFYRVENDRTSGEGQSGLGLAIAKSIVEAHGGRIWAESAANKGSVFILELPLG